MENDSKYCPYCGQDISLPDDPLIKKIRYSNLWKQRSALAIGSVAIAIMIVLLALVIVDDSPQPSAPQDEPIDHNPPDLIIELNNNSQIVLGDDFMDGSLLATMNAKGQLVITLNDEDSGRYSHYTWVLRDELSNTYLKKEKTEPEMVWVSPSVGAYTAMCYCYVLPEDEIPDRIYSGSINYQGDKTRHFIWDYDNRSFQIESVIPIEDQQKYSDKWILPYNVRSGEVLDAAWQMVVTGGSVDMLSGKLLNLFSYNYGPTGPGDYEYADFLLSFIQGMGFAHDSANHYRNNYWAFPAETLFNGCGDREDLAFLYASLLTAAGYECRLFNMPNTMMVAVVIDDVPEVTVADGYVRAEIVSEGVKYQICEPYSDTGSHLGTMKECYAFDSYGMVFYYYGEMCEGDFGLLPTGPEDKVLYGSLD